MHQSWNQSDQDKGKPKPFLKPTESFRYDKNWRWTRCSCNVQRTGWSLTSASSVPVQKLYSRSPNPPNLVHQSGCVSCIFMMQSATKQFQVLFFPLVRHPMLSTQQVLHFRLCSFWSLGKCVCGTNSTPFFSSLFGIPQWLCVMSFIRNARDTHWLGKVGYFTAKQCNCRP